MGIQLHVTYYVTVTYSVTILIFPLQILLCHVFQYYVTQLLLSLKYNIVLIYNSLKKNPKSLLNIIEFSLFFTSVFIIIYILFQIE